MNDPNETRPSGKGPGSETPATGLNHIVDADGVARRCAPWATPSIVARILAADAVVGRPITAADLDVLVNVECEPDR